MPNTKPQPKRNLSEIHEAFSNGESLKRFIRKYYGEVLTHGGHPSTYFRAIRRCKLAAKMTGSTIDQVVAEVTA